MEITMNKQGISALIMTFSGWCIFVLSDYYKPLPTIVQPSFTETSCENQMITSDTIEETTEIQIIETTKEDLSYKPVREELNFAYYFPEGEDQDNIMRSYAGKAYMELMSQDEMWMSRIYDYADLAPERFASRMGQPRSKVLGKYNPKDDLHDPSNPDTWIIHSFRNVRLYAVNGDKEKIDVYSNVAEIMSLANVYTYYKGVEDYDLFLSYAKDLWETSHSYSIRMSDIYYCDGCLNEEDEEERLKREAEAEMETAAYPSQPSTVETVENTTETTTDTLLETSLQYGPNESLEESKRLEADRNGITTAYEREDSQTNQQISFSSQQIDSQTNQQTSSQVNPSTVSQTSQSMDLHKGQQTSSQVDQQMTSQMNPSTDWNKEQQTSSQVDQQTTSQMSQSANWHKEQPTHLQEDGQTASHMSQPADSYIDQSTISPTDLAATVQADHQQLTLQTNPYGFSKTSQQVNLPADQSVTSQILQAEAQTRTSQSVQYETVPSEVQTEKKTNSEPFPSETQAEKDANFQIPPQETGINPDSQAYERNAETKTEKMEANHQTETEAESMNPTFNQENTKADTKTNEEGFNQIQTNHHQNSSDLESDEDNSLPNEKPTNETQINETQTDGIQSEDISSTLEENSLETEPEAIKCPGHIDLIVQMEIRGVKEKNGLFKVDPDGNNKEEFEENGWQGWTAEDREAAIRLASQDWNQKYGLSVSLIPARNPLTQFEIEEYMDRIPEDVSQIRKDLIRFALSSVGKVPYYWGGKPSAPNYSRNSFGAFINPDRKGRILKGLDCSGWISWVYWSVTGKRLPYESTSGLALCGQSIRREQLQPGDIIIRTGEDAHVIMFLEWTEDGRIRCIHESSAGVNNVTVAVRDANWPYYRKLVD